MYGGTGPGGRAGGRVGIGGVECASSLLPPFGAIKLIYGDEDTERSGAEIGGSARRRRRRRQGFLLLPPSRILFPPLLRGKKSKSDAP